MLRKLLTILPLLALTSCALSTYRDTRVGNTTADLNPTAASSRTSKRRNDEWRSQQRRNAARAESKAFFIKMWAELKQQVAIGKGGLLNQLVDPRHSDYYIYRSQDLIKELQTKQYEKVFQTDKEAGWKHFLWVVDNNVHYRELKIYLKTAEKEILETSDLFQNLITSKASRMGGSTLEIKDNAVTYRAIKQYKKNPKANVIDHKIHQELYEYAKRVRNKRLEQLLIKQQKRTGD